MTIIIDAHLPASLCQFFKEHECLHTSDLEHGNITSDSIINDISISKRAVVITKDTDFYYSYISSGKPHKLVLVKLGNMRIGELKAYFQRNNNKILKLLEHHSFISLEKDLIRVFE